MTPWPDAPQLLARGRHPASTLALSADPHPPLQRPTANHSPESIPGRSGLRSVLKVPLSTAEDTVGRSPDLQPKPSAFSEDDEAVAHILARHASIALATAQHEETIARTVDARRLPPEPELVWRRFWGLKRTANGRQEHEGQAYESLRP